MGELDVVDGRGTPVDTAENASAYDPPAVYGGDNDNVALHPLAPLAQCAAGTSSGSPSSASSILNGEASMTVGGPDAGAIAAGGATVPIRVRTSGKESGDFGSLRLVQEMDAATSGPLFRLRFSPDGQYLAAASDDGSVRLWAVRDGLGGGRSAAVFETSPRHVWSGHSGAVLDVSFSRSGLVLTASMDRSVRLWHVSRGECLGVFRHPDFATSVSFHPRDDRLFVSGSLDCRVRLWSVSERRVLEWKGLPPGNMVTAVAFTPSGRTVLAGTSTGVLLLFDVSSGPGAAGSTLAYAAQIHVHSRRGRNRAGSKICALRPLPGGLGGGERVLVSSNDSRLRLYSLSDRSLVAKYVGHTNATSQIDAAFSDDAELIVSGSEDCRVYVWSSEDRNARKGSGAGKARGFWACWLGRLISRAGGTRRVRATEHFDVGPHPVSCAAFAPRALSARLAALGLRPIPAAAAADAPATGAIVVAADLGGTVRVYENNALLDAWLAAPEACSADDCT